MRPDWQHDAACVGVDPDLFFPVKGETGIEAKRICRACPVRVDCLEFALAMSDNAVGVWGGTSEKERKAIRRTRRRAAQARKDAAFAVWLDNESSPVV